MVGKQSGRELRPYKTESGEELLLLHFGLLKPNEVFHYEHAQNRLQTWACRALGWMFTFVGFNCIGSILDVMGTCFFEVQKIID